MPVNPCPAQIQVNSGLAQVDAVLEQDPEIANRIGSAGTDFIAVNLPDSLKISGITLLLEIRRPQNSEFGACTAMGPAYPWVFVLHARKDETAQ